MVGYPAEAPTGVRFAPDLRLHLAICLVLLIALEFMTGCGATGAGNLLAATPTQQVSVTVSPSQAVLETGQSQQFGAVVKGATNIGVQWLVGGIPGGNPSVGIVSPSGLYTAPSMAPESGSVVVTATSLTDDSKSASATVRVIAPPPTIMVSISPIQINLRPGGTQQFSATVTGSANLSVVWAANGIVGGNASVGSISASGFYTAPANVFATETVTITARSASDSNSFATASAIVSATQDTTPTCGPPIYSCARTDLNVTPVPSTLPGWGNRLGANTSFTDATFNPAHPIQYVRVTDANSIAAQRNIQFTVPTGGSGDENTFNADDTLFTVGDVKGNTYFFGLDPAAMATGLVWVPGELIGAGAFSQTDRNIFYGLGDDGKIWSFDLAGCMVGQCAPPNAAKLFDFPTDCGVNPAIVWHAPGGIGGNDNVFAEAFSTGTQGSGHQVVAWNRSIGQCYLYDTVAGTVTQYPGGVLLGTVTSNDRYSVHNVKIDPSGTWLIVVEGDYCYSDDCVIVHAWRIGTAAVENCNLSCGGHFTETAAGWLNNDSIPGTVFTGIQMLFRSWSNFGTTHGSDLTELVQAHPPINIFGMHQSAKNDPLGTHHDPIFLCFASPQATTTLPYANEIVAYSQTPATVFRFGHSFNSSFSSSFYLQNCIGAASSTGQFYEFTTDGQGTLGSTSGGASCLLGGPQPLNNHNYPLNDLLTVPGGVENVFKVTTTGSTDSSTPTWPAQVGRTVTWGTATFTNEGPSTCRSDVMIVKAD